MELLDETPDGEILDTPVKPGTIRIILADSQAIYRVGIRKIFALEDDIRVVAQADSLENLRLALERQPADVVLAVADFAVLRVPLSAAQPHATRAPSSPFVRPSHQPVAMPPPSFAWRSVSISRLRTRAVRNR